MDDKAIVVGVDGSPAARAALRWAVDEAALRGCRVDAVLAWHLEYGQLMAPAPVGVDRDELRAAHREALQEAIAGLENVRGVLVEGDARDALVTASHDAQLLVVGSRGMGLLRTALLGSVSSYCVHHAACPVVVLRAPQPESVEEPRPVITPGPLL
ncbi:universal stress protein [Actinosynnema pretiosum]|uniref:Universal stress protein UspA n=1 Tax=Actinosynnema pretiosum TaxID=42197 RepID=A0A290Z397_9PSEU|nr:universal stress protein [Actinosynnema pretiosum]ATE53506.1 universal stress protein UspA [Actinosynnema pretiosum]